MKFAYYTSFFNSITSDKTSQFGVWLHYLLKSGSFDKENDKLFVITNEETNKQVTTSNIYKFITELFNATQFIQFINIDRPELEKQETFVKYFPPVLDILALDKPDYIFYCDIFNLISGNVRSKFENKEDIPAMYVMFEKSITDEDVFAYIKTTEWYSKNKEVVDKLPAINSSLFCLKNGNNELTLMKSVFGHVADEYDADSLLNYTMYSNSQFIGEKCYIELHPELFYNSIEINKLDSKKEIILLRNIDAELMNETLLISLICKGEKL